MKFVSTTSTYKFTRKPDDEYIIIAIKQLRGWNAQAKSIY